MNISLKLLDSNSNIQTKILDALAKQLKSGFIKAAQRIKKQLQSMVREAIQSQPEYNSLLSGQLKDELGIPNPTTSVNAIVDVWAENVQIITTPVSVAGSKIKGGISIGMIKQDYADVLGMDEATITDSKTGSVVPWLYWLLLGGGGILVKIML
jgi:hypothetical protein